jgi:hypothetical protein
MSTSLSSRCKGITPAGGGCRVLATSDHLAHSIHPSRRSGQTDLWQLTALPHEHRNFAQLAIPNSELERLSPDIPCAIIRTYYPVPLAPGARGP